jgi:hypothetical protein
MRFTLAALKVIAATGFEETKAFLAKFVRVVKKGNNTYM